MIVKSQYGVNQKVYRVNTVRELVHAAITTPYPIVQRAIKGDEFCIDTISDFSGEWITSVVGKKTKKDRGGKAEQLHIYQHPELEAIGKQIANALELKGPGNIDVIHSTETGVYYVLDINPRLGLNCNALSQAGINVAEIMIKLHRGMKPITEDLFFTPGIYSTHPSLNGK